jgi:hypothetical protein
MPREREVSGPRLSAVELMITGAIAGVAGKSITAPLDRVKILYQVRRAATAQAPAARRRYRARAVQCGRR